MEESELSLHQVQSHDGLIASSSKYHEHAREPGIDMADLPDQTDDKSNSPQMEEETREVNDSSRAPRPPSPPAPGDQDADASAGHHSRYHSHSHFRVYKRRWFGLIQLVLLNIVVSWDWLTFAPVSTTSAQYFNVSDTAINWLSTGFLFAFVVISPVVMWTLNRGPKEAIVWASVLLFLGNWIRYIGARATGGHYGIVMLGQILTGLAQPFVLAAPTRYSDLWFTERGRVSATAVASLANPFGGALGQLISPFWATKPSEVPNLVLYTAIISTIASLPSFLIPSKPPTPPSASSSLPKTPLCATVHALLRSPSFYLIFIPFSVYVGFFNAISSLLNQILEPYSYTETEAGICGALLIVVGLVAAALTSPLLDRTHAYLFGIKILVPLIALSYLAFVFAPQTRTLAAPYAIASILGAASFSLVPIALEYLVEVTWPASPEVGSTVCWAGGQLLGGIFIVAMNALKEGNVVIIPGSDSRGAGSGDYPPGNMRRALVFQAVISCAVVPLPLMLGIKRLGLGEGSVKGRLRLDEAGERSSEGGEGRAEGVERPVGGEERA
ncbi:MFS general substrate transporter [Lepidopterella palustris CBS 459.81]|uniref:MFS general substrate transporter n=1 Tax=Lepidopterella palustris CBS 459.81 TaxID=1314670 RepID=A0A8E2EA90_9PEZI|nr:MFS general substrate transporter [Lepidopterella palustris CBS 459.81]